MLTKEWWLRDWSFPLIRTEDHKRQEVSVAQAAPLRTGFITLHSMPPRSAQWELCNRRSHNDIWMCWLSCRQHRCHAQEKDDLLDRWTVNAFSACFTCHVSCLLSRLSLSLSLSQPPLSFFSFHCFFHFLSLSLYLSTSVFFFYFL